jgi:hypothetical protein
VSVRSIRSAAVIRAIAEPEIQHAVEHGHLPVSLGAGAAGLAKADQRKIASCAETGDNVKMFFRTLDKRKDEARVRSRTSPRQIFDARN